MFPIIYTKKSGTGATHIPDYISNNKSIDGGRRHTKHSYRSRIVRNYKIRRHLAGAPYRDTRGMNHRGVLYLEGNNIPTGGQINKKAPPKRCF